MLELVVWFWLFELIWLIDCLIVSLVDPLNWLTWSFELILWFESHAVLFWSDYVLILSPVYEFFNISFHFWWGFNIHSNFKCSTWKAKLYFMRLWHDNIICGLLSFSTMFGIHASLLIFFEEVRRDLQHSIVW